VLASCVAAYFAHAQVRVAETQINIANDKLKIDLFEKRYAIYKAAKDLIEYVMSNCNGGIDSQFVRKRFIELDESRFFFDCHIRKVLDDATKECDRFLVMIEERKQINVDDVALWRKTAEDVAKQQQKLNALYRSLPKVFEKVLAFRHLIERDR
jgi:hypothetical protein